MYHWIHHLQPPAGADPLHILDLDSPAPIVTTILTSTWLLVYPDNDCFATFVIVNFFA